MGNFFRPPHVYIFCFCYVFSHQSLRITRRKQSFRSFSGLFIYYAPLKDILCVLILSSLDSSHEVGSDFPSSHSGREPLFLYICFFYANPLVLLSFISNVSIIKSIMFPEVSSTVLLFHTAVDPSCLCVCVCVCLSCSELTHNIYRV